MNRPFLGVNGARTREDDESPVSEQQHVSRNLTEKLICMGYERNNIFETLSYRQIVLNEERRPKDATASWCLFWGKVWTNTANNTGFVWQGWNELGQPFWSMK